LKIDQGTDPAISILPCASTLHTRLPLPAGSITEAASRDAFAEQFTIIDELTLANGRTMFHLQKK
jgi:hypothetical protein